MSDILIDHDMWNTSVPKLPKASKITLGEIHGALPFDGVRNPSGRSSSSHRVTFTYRTAANDWKPKVGMAESAAEAAAGIQAVISPGTYDVEFQPLTVAYRDESGKERQYTHDLRITSTTGHRQLLFVRNGTSLSKPKTTRQIQAIAAATPKHAANSMAVVDADTYTRQRRDNLFRMHRLVFEPDMESDEIVLDTARRIKTLWRMSDLFEPAAIAQKRVFASCYRLIAKRKLRANLDHLLWEHSRIEVVA